MIASGLAYSMSNPMILQIFRPDHTPLTKDEFIDLVIHEIIHRFVGDFQMHPQVKPYWNFVWKFYKQEPKKTQNHILVYAVLTKILNEFNKSSLKVVTKDVKKWPDYKRAFEIVQERGADQLISEFLEHTKK